MPTLRPFAFALAGLLGASAFAQTFWQGDDDRPRRAPSPEVVERENAPLSPNVIVGVVLWVDAPKRLAVVRLDALPADAEAPLVARDADCTPRALLRPIRSAQRPSRTRAFRVTHGAVTVGQEVVLPEAALLQRCRATLAAHEKQAAPAKAAPAQPAPAAVPTAPAPAKPAAGI